MSGIFSTDVEMPQEEYTRVNNTIVIAGKFDVLEELRTMHLLLFHKCFPFDIYENCPIHVVFLEAIQPSGVEDKYLKLPQAQSGVYCSTTFGP